MNNVPPQNVGWDMDEESLTESQSESISLGMGGFRTKIQFVHTS